MQRLFPSPGGPTTVAEAYGVSRPRPDSGRPWIEVCMVASVDGSTMLDGVSGGLSSAADREVLLTLRSLADVIIVGAGTVRSEGYGPPKKPGQRIGVVTRSGDVDLDRPLFTSGAGFLIVPENLPPLAVETVRSGVGEIDLAGAVRRLPGDPAFVHAEGGPSLNGSLAEADLVDELAITTSPRLIGGGGSRITKTAADLSVMLTLAHVLEDDGFLFSRYVRSS